MTPSRDTSTGKVLEKLLEPVLELGGYTYQKQVVMGYKPDGKPYKADIVVEQEAERVVVSLKWQQVSGTAEQKIPFEVISLLYLIQQGVCERAYLVLGGEGWTPQLKSFYLTGGLRRFIKDTEKVHILRLEDFIAKVNSRRL
ncbi:MAG: hypothetical protein N2170_09135 [Bacteroidia bacterium]|nr:hypothetical protein [Bacteroidia bacterium]